MMPTAHDVAAYLGREADDKFMEITEAHLPVVTQMIRAYTRDGGFDATTGDRRVDVAAVILSVCARTVSNPVMVRSESIDDFSVDRTVVLGWTLAELAVLNRHRKRAT